jgi:outer membrane protein TolC
MPNSMMRFKLLPLFLLLSLASYGQDKNQVLTARSYLELVINRHPVIKQAVLLPEKARFDLMAARGNFDPKARALFNEKEFDEKSYWNSLDAYLTIPAWIGEFKAGFERSRGDYVNPERSTPDGGLLYVGYTLPLGAGLLMDDRRNTLRQAQQYVEASEAQQISLVNKFLVKASSDYWQWYFSWRQFMFVSEGLELAKVRFDAIKELQKNGNNSALDTVEAYTNLIQRINQLEQSKLDYNNARLVMSGHLWSQDGDPVELDSTKIPDFLDPNNYSFSLGKLDSLRNFATQFHPDLRKLNAGIRQLEFERKYRAEMLKPELNLNYNFLRNPINTSISDNSILQNNYKFGISAGMPLLLRKERGKLNGTRTQINIAELNLIETKRNIEIAVNVRFNELKNLEIQLNNQNKLLEAMRQLVEGEQIRFFNGESSVFLVNARENNLVNAGVKLAEIEMKYAMSIAYLYNAFGINSWNY